MTNILLGLAAGPVLFILAFLGLAKLAERGSLAHFALTCMLVPLVLVIASLAATSPEPTPEQMRLVDAGLAPDPGPLSAAAWVVLFSPSILSYLVTSIPLFLLLRRRAAR
jgi:hypothetical protein